MSNKKTISLITLITLMLLGLIINLEYNLKSYLLCYRDGFCMQKNI